MNSSSVRDRLDIARSAGGSGTTGAWRDYLAGLGLSLWLFSLIAPFLTLNDYYARVAYQETGAATKFQLVGLLMFVTLVLASRGFGIVRSEFIQCQSIKAICTTAVFTLLMFHAMISVSIGKSLVYAVTTWAILVLASSFWQGSLVRLKPVFILLACGIVVYLTLLTVLHGVSDRVQQEGTKIGGIQTNAFGKTALVALVCFFFIEGRARWLGVAACIALMFLVTSRSSIAAAVVFILAYYALTLTPGRAAAAVAFALGALSAAELGALIYSGTGVWDHVNQTVLFLDDPDRGLGSGLTGRSDQWLSGLALLRDRPLTGYGFRASPLNAHNGYINLALDVGLVISTLLILLFIGDAARRAILTRSWFARGGALVVGPEWDAAARLNAIAAAYIATSLLLWASEPIYLNIGFPYSILLFFFFSSPHLPPLAKCAPVPSSSP